MLNLSVASQINSSIESSAVMINPGSSGSKEPVAEEFGQVLEREVSAASGQQETDKTHKDSVPQKNTPREASAEKAMDVVSVESPEEITPDGANSFIQTLLSNVASEYPVHQTLPAEGPMLNPGLPNEVTVVPFVLPAPFQDVLITQHDKQAFDSMLPAANPLLLQKGIQPDWAAGYFSPLPNDFWRSLEAANSAASGRFLPFSPEMSEPLQINTGESIFPIHDESIAPQSLSLNHTTTAVSTNTSQQNIQVGHSVGQPQWGAEFAQKVVWLTSQQQQVAELHLNPAHLGPVEVMLTITQDQATAQFVSPHSAVREAIEQALPRLREMMAENGIQLGNVMVGADSFQQENKQQHAYYSEKDAAPRIDAKSEDARPMDMSLEPVKHQGLVNTYA